MKQGVYNFFFLILRKSKVLLREEQILSGPQSSRKVTDETKVKQINKLMRKREKKKKGKAAIKTSAA